MFYPGSKKQEESEYLNGKRDGRWQQWDTTGHQIRNEVYKDGVKIK
jgi:antitoxin component YwqK of YwqJK toxin-antitoxin module